MKKVLAFGAVIFGVSYAVWEAYWRGWDACYDELWQRSVE
jgi:hypothetical protein